MDGSKKGKRIAVFFAWVIAIGLPVGAWQAWPRLQAWYHFKQLFESLGRNEQGLSEYRHRRTGIVMVWLPGGRFRMGAQREDPEGYNYDPDADEAEGPVHEVRLSPFLIAKHEVTQAEWQQVMGSTPSNFEGGNLPVEQVSWEDIQEFELKTKLTLPTEGQWEFACRAGGQTVYCFEGDASALGDYGWYADNSGNSTQPVGRKKPNRFGLYDMHGSVWEWCEDVFDPEFYSRLTASSLDPLCTSGSKGRVGRGGYWRDRAVNCRAAVRRGLFPEYRSSLLGFRPAYPSP